MHSTLHSTLTAPTGAAAASCSYKPPPHGHILLHGHTMCPGMRAPRAHILCWLYVRSAVCPHQHQPPSHTLPPILFCQPAQVTCGTIKGYFSVRLRAFMDTQQGHIPRWHSYQWLGSRAQTQLRLWTKTLSPAPAQSPRPRAGAARPQGGATARARPGQN